MTVRQNYHYQYWSKRLTQELADDIGANLQPTWLWKLSAIIRGVGAEAQQQSRPLRHDQAAAKLEGSPVVHEFSGAETFRSTPYFIRSTGRLVFARSWVGTKQGHGSVIYANMQTPAKMSIEVCLFGSITNYIGYRSVGSEQAGWTSSAWASIQQLLDSRGAPDDSQGEDEALAFEAAKWARKSQADGQLRFDMLQRAEWCAQIYRDVTPTPGRWHGGWEQQTGRILVGSPLWIRTPLE